MQLHQTSSSRSVTLRLVVLYVICFQLPWHMLRFSVDAPGAIAHVIHWDFLKHLTIGQRQCFQELLGKLALEVNAVVGTLDVCNLAEVSTWIGFQDHQPTILASPHSDQIQDLRGQKAGALMPASKIVLTISSFQQQKHVSLSSLSSNACLTAYDRVLCPPSHSFVVPSRPTCAWLFPVPLCPSMRKPFLRMHFLQGSRSPRNSDDNTPIGVRPAHDLSGIAILAGKLGCQLSTLVIMQPAFQRNP